MDYQVTVKLRVTPLVMIRGVSWVLNLYVNPGLQTDYASDLYAVQISSSRVSPEFTPKVVSRREPVKRTRQSSPPFHV